MTDNYVSSISGPTDRSFTNNLQVEKYSRPKPTEAADARGDPQQTAAVNLPDQVQVRGPKPANVQLQFKIDPDTNDITVIVTDRDSDKVIRTIPPEELSELVKGDLLEVLT